MDKSNDPRRNFFAHVNLEELIAEQGVEPVKDPTKLLGDFWPEDEPVEDFIRALHEWRGHDRSDQAA